MLCFVETKEASRDNPEEEKKETKKLISTVEDGTSNMGESAP